MEKNPKPEMNDKKDNGGVEESGDKKAGGGL